MIGVIIALLPLYLRALNHIETNRPSKDRLFLYLIIFLSTFITCKIRSGYVRFAVFSLGFLTIVHQWEFFSANVCSQVTFILAGFLFFLKYFEYDDNIQPVQYIFNGMAVGAIIQSILGIGGYFGCEIYFNIIHLFRPDSTMNLVGLGHNNTVGSLGNYNLLASYLCITIPAFLSFKKYRFLIFIPITALLLTHSYMGIGSLIVGLIYYSRIVPKIWMYVLAIAGMFALPFLNLPFDSGRFSMWKTMLNSADLARWLIGCGPGWWPDQQVELNKDLVMWQEHNEFLTFFNIYGLLGFAILAPLFYRFLKTKDTNPILSSILFIIFCNSYGHFTLHQSTVAVIIIPVLALCLKDCA